MSLIDNEFIIEINMIHLTNVFIDDEFFIDEALIHQ